MASKNLCFEDTKNVCVVPTFKAKQCSWNKFNKNLSILNVDSEEKEEFKESKITNKSTLSLHIAAYENSVDSDSANSDGFGENEGLKKRNGKLILVKKWENSTLYEKTRSTSVFGCRTEEEVPAIVIDSEQQSDTSQQTRSTSVFGCRTVVKGSRNRVSNKTKNYENVVKQSTNQKQLAKSSASINPSEYVNQVPTHVEMESANANQQLTPASLLNPSVSVSETPPQLSTPRFHFGKTAQQREALFVEDHMFTFSSQNPVSKKKHWQCQHQKTLKCKGTARTSESGELLMEECNWEHICGFKLAFDVAPNQMHKPRSKSCDPTGPSSSRASSYLGFRSSSCGSGSGNKSKNDVRTVGNLSLPNTNIEAPVTN
uniref:FLYWCH-type domain-containing protein n=1 Tax=Panagrolaimus sp. ES5 TaxID=591445 RepID=A0AC34G1N7_9BILA